MTAGGRAAISATKGETRTNVSEKLKRRFPLFLVHTRCYDTTHHSATTPARLSAGNAARGGELGSPRAGARPRSAALGNLRRASCPSRSIDRFAAAPAWRTEVGWVGQRHGRVPGTDVPRRTTRRRRRQRRRDDSRIFFLPSSSRSFDRSTRCLAYSDHFGTACLSRALPSLSQLFILSISRFVSLSLSLSLSHARALNVYNVCHGCLSVNRTSCLYSPSTSLPYYFDSSRVPRNFMRKLTCEEEHSLFLFVVSLSALFLFPMTFRAKPRLIASTTSRLSWEIVNILRLKFIAAIFFY